MLKPFAEIHHSFKLPNGDDVIVYRSTLDHYIAVVIDSEGKTIGITYK
jgi:hypothetical protein